MTRRVRFGSYQLFNLSVLSRIIHFAGSFCFCSWKVSSFSLTAAVNPAWTTTTTTAFILRPRRSTSSSIGRTCSQLLRQQHPPHRLSACRVSSALLTMTSVAAASTGSSSGWTALPPPPVARRETDRVVFAGRKADGILAQSESSNEPLLDPPVAVADPYGWIRQDKDRDKLQPDILEHLTAENEYTNAVTRHLELLRKTLYDELVSAVQETDYTTPRPKQEYYYYSRTVKGLSYSIYCRAPRNSDEETTIPATLSQWDGTAESSILPGEQVLLDVNQLEKDHQASYCSIGSLKTSPSQKLLAYTVDLTGDEKYRLVVKHIATGSTLFDLPDLEIDGQVIFGKDDATVFYVKMDDCHRSYQVYRHNLVFDKNDAESQEVMLFQEDDQLFDVGISKSLDGRFLFVDSSSKERTEIWYLDLDDDNNATLHCIAKRRDKVLYEVEHRHGRWWILSNVDGLPNLAVFTAPAVSECQDQWNLVKDDAGQVLFDGKTLLDQTISGVTCFDKHVVLEGRQGGLPRVWILSGIEDSNDKDAGSTVVRSCEPLTFEEEAHDVGLSSHSEFDADHIMVAYDSVVTPPQWIDIQLDDTNHRTVWKERHVPGYNKELYGCERCLVPSRDGTTQIPVSIVYRKDVMVSDKPKPVHLYGYGSYGACMEADFDKGRLPLLQRGVVCVVAHIRGGGENGRPWYEEPNGAKYLCKQNTFHDFVDVARWLIDTRKVTTPELLACEGRSAGGLLIGAAINEAPELFRVALLGVAFVDVICTMTDSTIPLTVGEWEEWGNPNEKKYFDYMMKYCPMQNIRPNAKYPSALLPCGLHDPRVQYWEPVKFAAALRHAQDSALSGPVCVKIDMSSGHFSASDRYKYLRERAFELAFVLDQLGLVADKK